ncbi:hypothetical protein HMPREF1574_00542 [Gardnerella pickettii JCP7659]|nr:hypothetical protein HMPREF1574_00542 [Gardnerella pickettii JCP7659]
MFCAINHAGIATKSLLNRAKIAHKSLVKSHQNHMQVIVLNL